MGILCKKMDLGWFEMPEIGRRKLDGATWIPIHASNKLVEVGMWVPPVSPQASDMKRLVGKIAT